MSLRFWTHTKVGRWVSCLAAAAGVWTASGISRQLARAEMPVAQPVAAPLATPAESADAKGEPRVAFKPQAVDLSTLLKSAPSDRPMSPILESARDSLVRINAYQDYSCTLLALERYDGELKPLAKMPLKVRHEPFSVYVSYQAPANVKGQEVIYVKGRNNGKLLAHTTGIKHRLLGTLSLDPLGTLAMQGNRHPITEVGLRRLVERMIEVGEREVNHADTTVSVVSAVEISGRQCEGVQIVHAHKHPTCMYHKVRVYIDPVLQFPVRFESYDWPAAAGEEAPLLEQYTYTDLKFNNGFTDADFSTSNPAYAFGR